MLLLVYWSLKPVTLLKVTLLYGYFLRFLNCVIGAKSRKASHNVTKRFEKCKAIN